jgi:hypothetical protein
MCNDQLTDREMTLQGPQSGRHARVFLTDLTYDHPINFDGSSNYAIRNLRGKKRSCRELNLSLLMLLLPISFSAWYEKEQTNARRSLTFSASMLNRSP